MSLFEKTSRITKTSRKFRDNINKSKGKFGEVAFVQHMDFKGKKVKRTGIGSDYTDGKKLYEVKTGKSNLSRKQKETMKKNPKKYEVIRYGLRTNI